MNESQLLTAMIIAGAILTFIYSILKEWFENKRHSRKLKFEERRAKLDEEKLAIDLYNQRELKIFEARLENYRDIFIPLMYLEKNSISDLSNEQAIEIEKSLKIIFYEKVSHCMSPDSIKALDNLRQSLIAYSKGEINSEKLRNIKLKLLNTLHMDLGRTGSYLGRKKPLIEKNRDEIQELIQKQTTIT